MGKKILLFLLFCGVLNAFSQNKKAYELYTATGKKSNFEKLLKKITKTNVVFFGEIHNNPIAHWLEYELIKDLSTARKLTIGLEMFETNQQKELNLFLQDSMDYMQLANKLELWSNYKTDYKPVVDFAKSKNIPVIATNVPNQYAKLVHAQGFEILENLIEEEQQFIAPQPMDFDPELPQYKKILTMMEDHGTPNLVKAQAIKDATMAYFIAQNCSEEGLFVHVNGSFHSDFKEGILWYLQKYEPNVTGLTISVVEQKTIDKLDQENINKADFIICVPSSMTKTY